MRYYSALPTVDGGQLTPSLEKQMDPGTKAPASIHLNMLVFRGLGLFYVAKIYFFC